VAASLWATQFVSTLLYGLQPRDPVTLAAALVILTSLELLTKILLRGTSPTFSLGLSSPFLLLRGGTMMPAHHGSRDLRRLG
jgi:hypothetical protein